MGMEIPMRWRRVRAANARSRAARAAKTRIGTTLCQGPKRLNGREGIRSWWAIVVTVIVVFVPGATEAGFAVQVVAAAGSEQVTATLEANPPAALMARVYVAGEPAFTVTVVGAAGVMVKSAVGTNEKFNTLLPPKAIGSGGNPIPAAETPGERIGPAEPTIT
jgi:hypothetical protein